MNADENFADEEDARLHGEHAALLRGLERIKRRLARVDRLTDAVRAVDAARNNLWIPYVAHDSLDLSPLGPLLEEMLAAVGAAATAHEQLVAKKTLREERRASVKVEEMAWAYADETEAAGLPDQQAGYDTDATEEQEYTGKDGAQQGGEEEEEEKKKKVVEHRRPETPEKERQVAVALSRSIDSRSDVNKAISSDPLVERALDCLRFAQTLTQSTNQDVTRPLSKLVEVIVSIVVEADKAFTFPRSGKSRESIPQDLSKSLGRATKLAVDRLLQVEVSLGLAPSMFRLHEMILSIRHRELKQLFTSWQPVLGRVISAFAETLGGMKRTTPQISSEMDESAQDCFALAINLLTTSEDLEHEKARDTLIDDLLHALKKNFRPAVLRLQHKDHRRRQRDDGDMDQTNGVLMWAGRVLLLAARIVAHVVATRALLKADNFFKVLSHIELRHELFPRLFQRMERIVRKAPFAPRPLAPLDLPSESRRIQAMCVQLQTAR